MPEDSAQTTNPQVDIVSKTKDYLASKAAAPTDSGTQPANTATPTPPPAKVEIPPLPGQGQVPNTAPVGVGGQPQTSPQPTAPQVSTPQSKSVRGMTNIADALYVREKLDQESLKQIKFESVTKNLSLENILISKGIVSQADIQQLKSEMYGIPYIDISAVSIPKEILAKVDHDLAEKNIAIAFEETSSRVKVAMADPLDLQKVQFLESVLSKRVEPYYANPEAIKHIIDTKYGAQISNEIGQAVEQTEVVDLNSGGSKLKVEDIQGSDLSSAPVAKIVNLILEYAVKHHASDVHIEPRESKISVRYRVHGILEEKLSLPVKIANQVVTRIKILANMKIDEHRVPQDNRFQIKADSGLVDIRVSVMPSIYGEKVVLRLLEKNRSILQLEETGLRGTALKRYRDALSRTQGIILITGPTGSGKTVTLSSSLSSINSQEVNILTVEDPVEIRIDGVTQVQVNNQVGLTFPMALRSFLRQDPDIIMVGEIRDAETAELAVQAALTGHLVLATLHTNSAAGALPRLLDMGIEPFLLASTINVVVGQRLVRKLCDEGKEKYQAEPEMVQKFHQVLDGLQLKNSAFGPGSDQLSLYKPVPSPKCDDSGYSGRIGIFEVMPISDNIGKLVMKQSSIADIQTQAVSEGMITMAQDGFLKAMEGMTTIEEVLRVQST